MGIAPVIGGRGGVSVLEAQANARGVKFEPFDPCEASSQTAPTTQTVYGVSVWVRGGALLTGIKIRVGVAAAGTNPTTVRFGLADATGKILALSGNYGTGGTNNATTIFAAGANSIPFASTYTPPADAIVIPCFVCNGTWGTTQPTPIQVPNSSGAAYTADGSNPPINFGWTSQTDLPAVGSSATITSGIVRTYWLALY